MSQERKERRRRKFRHWLLGPPLRSDEAPQQKIGVLAGISFLGLDALGSASYGPEAALTILLPLGPVAFRYIVPLLAAIVALLLIVQFSYRQTIAAYPDGGGSYIVATHNLGPGPGLLAGAALWTDYVLNAAVGISAGVGALVSAIPALLPHTLALCLGILLLLMAINLRGVRQSGFAFMVPTYLFVVSLGAVVVLGLVAWARAHGQHLPDAPPASTPGRSASLWLLLRSFSAGCTAMTGVEAVSDAVPVFREPRVRNAHLALAGIVGVLAFLLLGIGLLSRFYGVGAMRAGEAGYESVLSQLTAATAGRGVFYGIVMGSITAVLCLSANTSFADFPRLCRFLAADGFLPLGFARQGARLVYWQGVVLLTVLAGCLLVVFGGLTDRLVPLFAVGAFLAFTLSQFGMVAHLRRTGAGRHGALVLSALGGVATAAVLVVIVLAKFREGAWLTVLVLALLVLLFRRIRRHTAAIDHEMRVPEPLDVTQLEPPVVVVPLKRLDKVGRRALRFALTISRDITAVQLLAADENHFDMSTDWTALIETPCQRAGLPPPKLVVLRSSFREVIDPLVRHVHRMAMVSKGRSLVVVVPQLIERHWYHMVFRNHSATLLKARLLLEGVPGVVVANVPWYLGEWRPSGASRAAAPGTAPK